jgi:acyl carrier protein
MTHEEIRRVVLDVLGDIAPDADLGAIDPSADLQRQFDLDSFDFLNLVVGLSERLGVEVPERDYADMATLDGCVAYLSRLLAPTAAR